MIINTKTAFTNQPDERRVLQTELAFVEKATLRLFIPLVEEHWNDRIVFSNQKFVRCWRDMDSWFFQTVPSWEVIFKFDPITLEKL